MQLHELAATETSTLTKAVSASLDKVSKAAAAEIERLAAQARAEAQKAADAAAAERAAAAAALEDEQRQRAQLADEGKQQARQIAEQAQRLKEQAQQLKDQAQQLKEQAKQLKEQSAAQSFADAARREAEAAREKDAVRVRELEQALKESDAAHAAELRAMRAKLTKSALQPLDHLRGAFDRFRAASSIDDVLQILLEGLATEFARVAVFDVNAHRLEVSRHAGFESGGDMSKVVVPLTMQSPLTRAVREGRVQGLTSRELTETTRALVGGSPNFVLVLPVPIRGQVKAVVYADDSGQTGGEAPSPERRVRFAEILLWHTVPLLTRLALEEEALAEFREYAASMIADLESVYVADSAKFKAAELRKRLQLNLQYARRRFSERMQAESPAAAGLLDEQLAAAIERKNATPFGRDLAAVCAGELETGRPTRAAAADAS